MDFRPFTPIALIAALIGVGSAFGILRSGASSVHHRLGQFPTRIDLGTLVEGQIIEMDVPLGPLPPRVLERLRGQTSCGCTSFVLPTADANGEGATVKIRFDSTGKGAEIRESVALAWDEKGAQSTECRLSGWIVKGPTGPIQTERLKPGKQTVRLAIPFARETASWKVESQDFVVEDVSQGNGQLVVKGTVSIPDEPNPAPRSLRISHDATTLTVPFRIRPEATWKSIPSILNLGTVRPGDGVERTAHLELTRATRLEVERAPDGVEVKLASSEGRRWTLTATARGPLKSLLNSEIVLRRSPGQKIVIPIVGVSASPEDPRPLGGKS